MPPRARCLVAEAWSAHQLAERRPVPHAAWARYRTTTGAAGGGPPAARALAGKACPRVWQGRKSREGRARQHAPFAAAHARASCTPGSQTHGHPPGLAAHARAAAAPVLCAHAAQRARKPRTHCTNWPLSAGGGGHGVKHSGLGLHLANEAFHAGRVQGGT